MGEINPALTPWGPYASYADIARLEYSRLLWKSPRGRARLLANWTHPDHPGAERFARLRPLVERLLESTASDADLDRSLRAEGLSRRPRNPTNLRLHPVSPRRQILPLSKGTEV